jgi:hypothetical protein
MPLLRSTPVRKVVDQSHRTLQQHLEATRFSSGARNAVVLQKTGQPYGAIEYFICYYTLTKVAA